LTFAPASRSAETVSTSPIDIAAKRSSYEGGINESINDMPVKQPIRDGLPSIVLA
jgi:hypothetical protein